MKFKQHLLSALGGLYLCLLMCIFYYPAEPILAAATEPAMTLTSSAFHNHAEIPRRFTADGRDISPPLSWHHVPAHTVSLLLTMIDIDAPGPQPFLHWMMINIPPSVTRLPENIAPAKHLKNIPAARQGKNDFGKMGYRGPAPPVGPAHHYQIMLYALSRKLLDAPDCLHCLQHAIAGYVLARSVLHGRYSRDTK